MFAILCRRRWRILPKDCVFIAQQFGAAQKAVLVKSVFSSVCENDSEKSFTVSYLMNSSCGLSPKDAVSASEKLCLNSPEKPDAVLKHLREYGFTDAHIRRMVAGRPKVLVDCPDKSVSPKLEVFRSIGVPLPVLAHKLSANPSVLTRSLENSLIPLYNELKSLLRSDERVVHAFLRAPTLFGRCLSEGISSNISILRERGVPESSIVSLIMYQPSVLIVSKERLAVCVDRVVEMGFDISETAIIHAIQAFDCMTESTLKHKMDVYKSCGWSESDTIAAFLRHPICMFLSERNIMGSMEVLLRELGCKPVDIAQCPVLLGYSLDKRIRQRCLVARILKEKGLTSVSATTLLALSEQRFLKTFIFKYQKNIPELLDIYQGNLSPVK